MNVFPVSFVCVISTQNGRIKNMYSFIAKQLKPHVIYISVVIMLGLIRISSTTTGSISLDNAINDIAIGGLSSVIVAWIIFIDNCRRTKKRNNRFKLQCFLPFAHALAAYMQEICCCCTLYDLSNRHLQKTFSEWDECYFVKHTQYDTTNFIPLTRERATELVLSIVAHEKLISQSQIWIRNEGIMTLSEIQNIAYISATLSNFLLDSDSTEPLSNNTIHLCHKFLLDILSSQPEWTRLTTTPYSWDSHLQDKLLLPNKILD